MSIFFKSRYIGIGVFCYIVFAFSPCRAQKNPSFAYQSLPANIVASQMPDSTQQLIKSMTLYDMAKDLPAGYVKDGSVDYTQYLQATVNNHPKVLMPDFPVMVNQKGISLTNNSVVVFNKHSSLVLMPNGSTSYNILVARNVKNIKIYDPVIVGDRKKHTGTTGEWGMGISIQASQNVVIYNPNVSDCWGDGLYIAGTDNAQSENVTVYNARLDFNRRNGISVVSGKNIKIIDPVISNTSGTYPMAGIDVEPNNNQDVLEGVDIEHPVTFNNASAGILVCLPRLPGALAKTVDITLNNYVDYKSYIGLYIYGFSDHYDSNAVRLKGNINITNPKLTDNVIPFKGNSNFDFGPNMNFTHFSVLKSDKKGVARPDDNSVNDVKSKFSNEHKFIFN